MPPPQAGKLPFPASVVNTAASTEIEFGCGVSKPDPGNETAGAVHLMVHLMAHSDQIPVTARIRTILLGGGPPEHVARGTELRSACISGALRTSYNAFGGRTDACRSRSAYGSNSPFGWWEWACLSERLIRDRSWVPPVAPWHGIANADGAIEKSAAVAWGWSTRPNRSRWDGAWL